jgi:hypothetical protein
MASSSTSISVVKIWFAMDISPNEATISEYLLDAVYLFNFIVRYRLSNKLEGEDQRNILTAGEWFLPLDACVLRHDDDTLDSEFNKNSEAVKNRNDGFALVLTASSVNFCSGDINFRRRRHFIRNYVRCESVHFSQLKNAMKTTGSRGVSVSVVKDGQLKQ